MRFIWNTFAFIAAVIAWQVTFRVGKFILKIIIFDMSNEAYTFSYVLFLVELFSLFAGIGIFYLAKELMTNRDIQLHPAPIILYVIYVILVLISHYIQFFSNFGFVWDITAGYLIVIGGAIFATPEFLYLLTKR